MRYLCTLALVTAFVALSAWSAEPTAQNDDASALIALEHTWVDALQKNDVKALTTILVKTYVDTDETGHQGDKAAVLGALKSGALKLSLIELSDMKPVIYGDAAVVTGASLQHGTYEGQPLAARIVFTDTFIRAGKTWKVVASQRTTAPKQ
jgi:ketosteroid isomerase-like protein